MQSFQLYGLFTKKDDAQRIVEGYMSSDSNDIDSQIVDPDWLRKAIPGWMRYANVRLQHDEYKPIGRAVEVRFDEKTKNPYIKVKVVDDAAWKLVKEGVLNGFSVGVKNPRLIMDGVAKNGRLVGGELVEVSLVDRPANADCVFTVVKAAKNNTWLDCQTNVLYTSKGELVMPTINTEDFFRQMPVEKATKADPKTLQEVVDESEATPEKESLGDSADTEEASGIEDGADVVEATQEVVDMQDALAETSDEETSLATQIESQQAAIDDLKDKLDTLIAAITGKTKEPTENTVTNTMYPDGSEEDSANLDKIEENPADADEITEDRVDSMPHIHDGIEHQHSLLDGNVEHEHCGCHGVTQELCPHQLVEKSAAAAKAKKPVKKPAPKPAPVKKSADFAQDLETAELHPAEGAHNLDLIMSALSAKLDELIAAVSGKSESGFDPNGKNTGKPAPRASAASGSAPNTQKPLKVTSILSGSIPDTEWHGKPSYKAATISKAAQISASSAEFDAAVTRVVLAMFNPKKLLTKSADTHSPEATISRAVSSIADVRIQRAVATVEERVAKIEKAAQPIKGVSMVVERNPNNMDMQKAAQLVETNMSALSETDKLTMAAQILREQYR